MLFGTFLFLILKGTTLSKYTYLLHFTLNSTTHTLALKPKPLVMRSTDRGRYSGSLKKWHRSPKLWHRLPRRACSKTKTIGSAELGPRYVPGFALKVESFAETMASFYKTDRPSHGE